MKRLIIIFMVSMLYITSAVAHESGFVVDKQVNGDFKESFVANFDFGRNYPNSYIDTELVFIAPRANALNGNHEYFGAVIGSEFKIFNAHLDVNTGARYYWEGNSRNLPGGYTEWQNTVKLLWKF